MRTLAVIPARYASTRFPGKPLATIGGKPMLLHVWEKVNLSGLFEKVIVATDDERIMQAAEAWGAEVAMTSPAHLSGTDRCAEVLEKSGFEAEAVVNIQGDEPFIEKEPLQQLLRLLAKDETQIATLYSFLGVQESAANPNLVKLVTDAHGKALYFSRSPIPFQRKLEEGSDLRYKKHIGIYGFKAETLLRIVRLAPSALERTESLEQLRWLENGFGIFAAETAYKTIAVDTPEDLAAAERHFQQLLKETY